jgi:hypothetical protein
MFNTGTVIGVSANILGLISTYLYPVFLGGALIYHLYHAFETARLVMGRRNVDFEKEAAILEHVLPKEKMAKRIALSLDVKII